MLRERRDEVGDVRRMRALGFRVSVADAEYMARVFREAGIPALAVSGVTREQERDDADAALEALRDREGNCLFTADLFNEGLDVPAADTVLVLRPTQSATLLLQQLGRGLRRAPGKAVLTVLDFIGQHRGEFRFDSRYRALTGASRKGLERQIEQGFPFLPAGSQLVSTRSRRASCWRTCAAGWPCPAGSWWPMCGLTATWRSASTCASSPATSSGRRPSSA